MMARAVRLLTCQLPHNNAYLISSFVPAIISMQMKLANVVYLLETKHGENQQTVVQGVEGPDGGWERRRTSGLKASPVLFA